MPPSHNKVAPHPKDVDKDEEEQTDVSPVLPPMCFYDWQLNFAKLLQDVYALLVLECIQLVLKSPGHRCCFEWLFVVKCCCCLLSLLQDADEKSTKVKLAFMGDAFLVSNWGLHTNDNSTQMCCSVLKHLFYCTNVDNKC